MPYYPPGFTPAFGTVGAPTIRVGTTGFNILDANTLQGVVAGAAVTTVTAALLTIAGIFASAAGTITTSKPNTITQTWNGPGVTMKALTVSVTDPAANAGSGASSLLFELLCGTSGTTSMLSVSKIGNLTIAGNFAASSGSITANSSLNSATLAVSTSATIGTTLGVSGALSVAQGTITVSAPLALSQTWNASGVTFKAMTISVPDQAANAGSAAGSLLLDLLCGTAGTTSVFSVRKDGLVTVAAGGSGGYYIGTAAGIDANSNNLALKGNSVYTASVFSTSFRLLSTAFIAWSDGTSFGGTDATSLHPIAAGIVGIRGASVSAGGALNLLERTAPSAPGADQVTLYAVDNGGKTEIRALFNSGAAQLVAAQP